MRFKKEQCKTKYIEEILELGRVDECMVGRHCGGFGRDGNHSLKK